MYRHLSFLSFCFLLTACVYPEEMNTDIYAQSDLLPPKTVQEQQPVPANTIQTQKAPPIVLPQQAPIPAHLLNAQQNPIPFVQTIVIPQPTPITYPNAMGLPAQNIMPYGTIPAMVPQGQSFYNQQPKQEYIVSPKTAHPVQQTPSSGMTGNNVYPLWARPVSDPAKTENINSSETKPTLNTESINIPRW